MTIGSTKGKDRPKATSSEAYLNLDLSVLTDRGGSSAAIMDKSGIPIFDILAEEQISRYEQMELQKIAFYKTEVFSETTSTDEVELDRIRQQVFLAAPQGVDRAGAAVRPAGPERGAWMLVMVFGFGIILSAAYARKKKKERERKIADLDNRYDE